MTLSSPATGASFEVDGHTGEAVRGRGTTIAYSEAVESGVAGPVNGRLGGGGVRESSSSMVSSSSSAGTTGDGAESSAAGTVLEDATSFSDSASSCNCVLPGCTDQPKRIGGQVTDRPPARSGAPDERADDDLGGARRLFLGATVDAAGGRGGVGEGATASAVSGSGAGFL